MINQLRGEEHSARHSPANGDQTLRVQKCMHIGRRVLLDTLPNDLKDVTHSFRVGSLLRTPLGVNAFFLRRQNARGRENEWSVHHHERYDFLRDDDDQRKRNQPRQNKVRSL